MSILTALKSAIKHLPVVRELVSERDKFHSELMGLKRNIRGIPPGHFYSPIPSLEEIARDEARIFGRAPRSIPGLELYESEQLALLEQFIPFCDQIPFQPNLV